MAHPIGPPVAHGIKVHKLTNDKREVVIMSLSERSRDGVLPLGAITEVGKKFPCATPGHIKNLETNCQCAVKR